MLEDVALRDARRERWRFLSGALSLLAVTIRSIRTEWKERISRGRDLSLVSLLSFSFPLSRVGEKISVGSSARFFDRDDQISTLKCSCISRIPPDIQFSQHGTRDGNLRRGTERCSESLKKERTVNRYDRDFVCVHIYSIKSDLAKDSLHRHRCVVRISLASVKKTRASARR